MHQTQQRNWDEWNSFIAEKIKKAREESGISQEELAKAIQRNRVTISDYERGRSPVGASDLMGIAQTLQKPISYFLPDSSLIYGINEDALSNKEKELVALFRDIREPKGEDLAIDQMRKVAKMMGELQKGLTKSKMENFPKKKKR